jgi:mycothiol synthase
MISMEPVLPETLVCRPLRMDEAPEAAGLTRACEKHFLGEAFVEEEDVIGEWSRPEMDFAADTRGVYDAGQLVAAVELEREQVYLDVLPSHLGRGIGSALADWVEAAAIQRGVQRVSQFVAVRDVDGSRILRARGYAPTYTDWILRMDEGTSLHHHRIPPDVRIETFTDGDGTAVHALIEAAFSGWEGRPSRSYEDWERQNLHREGTDPLTFRVARAGNEIVGACVVHDGDGKAWVHQVAVRNDRRGQGIGQELLAATFEAARRRGLPVGELATDSRTGALGLYERLGMRIVAQLENWRKPLL